MNNKKEIDFCKWTHGSLPDEKLKEIAKDIFNSKIFTSRHMGQHDNIMTVFMPLLFIGQRTFENDRKGKLEKIEYEWARDEYFKSINTTEEEARAAWFNNIGLVYESYDKAAPTSINGLPIFYSCNILSIEDTNKMDVYYEKYKELMEQAESKF